MTGRRITDPQPPARQGWALAVDALAILVVGILAHERIVDQWPALILIAAICAARLPTRAGGGVATLLPVFWTLVFPPASRPPEPVRPDDPPLSHPSPRARNDTGGPPT